MEVTQIKDERTVSIIIWMNYNDVMRDHPTRYPGKGDSAYFKAFYL